MQIAGLIQDENEKNEILFIAKLFLVGERARTLGEKAFIDLMTEL